MIVFSVLSHFVLAVLAPWLGRLFGSRSGWIFALLPAALAAYFAGTINEVGQNQALHTSLLWVPGLNVNFDFHLDGLALLFALLITGLGALVLAYSQEYLAGDPQLGSFYAYLLMFMGSMLGLVLSDNVFAMYVFWELTSISSFFLIGFRHSELRSRQAALQAILVTSTGGLCLLAGLVLLGQAQGSYRFSEWVMRSGSFHQHPLYVPALTLVLLGAFTKSAQFPFHFWLRSAMEAPTPVSAYLHSATMVQAGVYLMARLSPVLGGTEAWFYVLTITGAFTMVAGAYLALRHTDMKVMLAYSTISVLGLMTMALGVGTEAAICAGMFYVVVHALYKGALFLVVGAVDHHAGTREVAALSNLYKAMPVVAAAAAGAALSMAGFPLFSGFIGKELLYEAVSAGIQPEWLTFASVLANSLLFAVALGVGVKPFFSGQMPAVETKTHSNRQPIGLWLGPAILAAAGLLLGVVPGAGEVLVRVAATSVYGKPVKVDLSLWHGFSTSLLLGLLTFAIGAAVYLWWRRKYKIVLLPMAVEQWGPARGYAFALVALNKIAWLQTRFVQSGFLRFYVLATILATVVLVGYPLAFRNTFHPARAFENASVYEAALAVFILVSAILAGRSRSRMGAVTALGAVGYGVSVLFVLFGAPDLAMTQFLVETLVVILFILVLYRLPRFTIVSQPTAHVRDGLISAAGGALISVLVLAASAIPVDRDLINFYAQNSVPQGHGRNLVNVVLVDFRGLDTMGEITVLATAGVGVYGLLRLRTRRREAE